jgi:hypothetical protein
MQSRKSNAQTVASKHAKKRSNVTSLIGGKPKAVTKSATAGATFEILRVVKPKTLKATTTKIGVDSFEIIEGASRSVRRGELENLLAFALEFDRAAARNITKRHTAATATNKSEKQASKGRNSLNAKPV